MRYMQEFERLISKIGQNDRDGASGGPTCCPIRARCTRFRARLGEAGQSNMRFTLAGVRSFPRSSMIPDLSMRSSAFPKTDDACGEGLDAD